MDDALLHRRVAAVAASPSPGLARLAAALLALLTLAVPGASQPLPEASLPSPLTLDAALQYADEHYPTLRAAVEEVAAASAGIAVARTAYLPRVEALWQSNRGTVNNITGPLLPQSVLPPISGPPLAATSAGTAWGSATGVLMSWEPVDFGQRSASVREAEATVIRAQAGQALTRLQVQHAVGLAYLDVLAAREAVRAADADAARRQTVLRSARALADAQLRAGAEAARATAEHAAAVTRVIQARQALRLAEIMLSRALGTETLPDIADGGALLQRIPASGGVAPDDATHPLLQWQQASIDLAQARDSVLASSFRPRILLQGSTAARGSGAQFDGRLEGGASGLWPDRVNWTAGLQVVLPNLFDVVGIGARRQAAAAEVRAARARFDEQRLRLTADQRAAEVSAEAAREWVQQMPVQLEAARTSEVQARARYEAGLAGIVDVADSQALLALTETQDAAARVTVWRALLARAVAFDAMDTFLALVRDRK
jgi:outer membrane protein TolC